MSAKTAKTGKGSDEAKRKKRVAKARLELDRCVTDLLLKEPFFGHLLASVVRRVSFDLTPTAAVSVQDGHVRMTVNPDFFVGTITSRRERGAIVKHEALHLLFKHCVRRDAERKREPILWNVAADLVVNQVLSPWPLPEGGLRLETFPDLKLKRDQTADHYYDRLRKLARDMRDALGEGSERGGGSNAGASDGQGRSDDGQSQAGASSGSAGPNQDDDGNGSQQHGACGLPGLSASDWRALGVRASQSAEVLGRLAETWHSDHRLWGAMDEATADAADEVVDGLVRRTAMRVGPKHWGKLPGPLRQLIEAALERAKPKVDWRRVVRMFSNSSRKTRIAATLRRRSQRYGTFPGIKVKRMQRLAIGLDTSGSISDDELSLFFSEVHGIWRQGAEVHVFECDAAVQRRYPYRGKLPSSVAGRGGTVFDPVFVALRENRMERWDGCIYLTDGYAAEPRVRPPCKLLWVITPSGKIGSHLRFGRAVQIT